MGLAPCVSGLSFHFYDSYFSGYYMDRTEDVLPVLLLSPPDSLALLYTMAETPFLSQVLSSMKGVSLFGKKSLCLILHSI